jgi:hypothetical protein
MARTTPAVSIPVTILQDHRFTRAEAVHSSSMGLSRHSFFQDVSEKSVPCSHTWSRRCHSQSPMSRIIAERIECIVPRTFPAQCVGQKSLTVAPTRLNFTCGRTPPSTRGSSCQGCSEFLIEALTNSLQPDRVAEGMKVTRRGINLPSTTWQVQFRLC